MISEQFFFCCFNRSANIFCGHVPCKFFYSNYISERGRVIIGSICVSL